MTVRTDCPPTCAPYISNTWKVGVATNRSPSARNERLEAVDELRDVGHVDLVGVPVEGVERQRGHQRVAQRPLCPSRCAGLISVPGRCQVPHSSTTSLTRAGDRFRPAPPSGR